MFAKKKKKKKQISINQVAVFVQTNKVFKVAKLNFITVLPNFS